MVSPVDTSVKFYRSNFPGAPTLNGTIGGGLSVLVDCLVNGFGSRTAVSVVVASGVATVTLASDANNANLLHSVILVSGATGGWVDLNGEQRVTAVSATTLAFATALADGTATGTITVKTAGAGWTQAFTGTNKTALKSADPTALGMYLRVDDSATLNMRVRSYEAMTDVDTGTGPFPTVAQSAGGGYWAKSTLSTSAAAAWDLFADSRGFYFAPLAASSNSGTSIGQAAYWFGDIVAFKNPDSFACLLTYSGSAPSNSSSFGSAFYLTSDTANGPRVLARSYTGLGSAVYAYQVTDSGGASSYSGLDASFGVFPTPTDGALRFSRLAVNEVAQTGSSAILRGLFPGVYHVPQSGLNAFFQRLDYVTATSSPISGRKLAVVYAGASFNDVAVSGSSGRGLIDITGPWR